MKYIATSVVVCASLASLVACKSTDTTIRPEARGGSSAAVGGSAGSPGGGTPNGGSTAASGVGGTSGGGSTSLAGTGGVAAAASGGAAGAPAGTGGAGAAGRAPHAKCRTDLPGPTLVDVTAPDGTGFCIDATPVTAGQYGGFLKAKATDVSGQGKDCTWNTSFVPQPPTESTVGCSDVATIYNPDSHPEWPMVCTDYCDAVAYCQWAGKRLCGRLANTGAWPMPGTGFDSPIGSELTYACTQGGKTTYIYGDTYDAKSAPTTVADAQAKAAVNKGSVPPFDQLTGFNGYPNEWEDGCVPGASLTLPPAGCHLRWGGPAGVPSDADSQRCDKYGLALPGGQGPGFRCCTD